MQHQPNRQQECFWPSGRTITRMGTIECLAFLSDIGLDTENDRITSLRMSELRSLIQKLKRDSHENGDCECPAARYIRRGGGKPHP